MNRFPPIRILGLTLILHATFAKAALLSTVSTYDENTTQTNTWNLDAVTPGTVITSTASNGVGGAAFTSTVATAYANDLGGVLNFDSGELATMSGLHEVGLGATNAFKVEMTTASGNGQWTTTTSSDRVPISGTNRFNADQNMTFTFGDVLNSTDDIQAGMGVAQFGITLIGRGNRIWNGTVTATFADLTTDTFEITGLGNDGATNSEDTFLGFAAPTGTFISSVDFVSSGSGSFTLSGDDLGIVVAVIPEPSTWVLLGGAMSLVGLCRRRVSG